MAHHNGRNTRARLDRRPRRVDAVLWLAQHVFPHLLHVPAEHNRADHNKREAEGLQRKSICQKLPLFILELSSGLQVCTYDPVHGV